METMRSFSSIVSFMPQKPEHMRQNDFASLFDIAFHQNYSADLEAAIDHQELARNITCCGTGEKQDCAGDLGCRAQTAEGHAARSHHHGAGGLEAGAQFFRTFRRDATWQHRVDSDV